MRKRNRSKPQPTPDAVSTAFDSSLLLYTIAAGATLTAVSVSHAEVLFTPSSSVIIGPTASLVIDMDHDGSAAFLLKVWECGDIYSGYGRVPCITVEGTRPGNTIGVYSHGAAALAKNVRILSAFSRGLWWPTAVMAASSRRIGNWNNVEKRFLGVQFG